MYGSHLATLHEVAEVSEGEAEAPAEDGGGEAEAEAEPAAAEGEGSGEGGDGSEAAAAEDGGSGEARIMSSLEIFATVPSCDQGNIPSMEGFVTCARGQMRDSRNLPFSYSFVLRS